MRSLTLVSILLGALPGGPLLAQSASPEDVRQQARMHAGPFYFTPTLALQELGLDTNVFNEAADPKSDFTFLLSPRLVTAVPIARRALLQFETVMDIRYYQKYETQRSVSPRVDVLGELYLNHLTMLVRPSYLRTRQRPNYEIDTRPLREEQGVHGGIRLATSSKLSLELAGGTQRTDYAEDERYNGVSLENALNHDSNSVQLVPRWRLTPLTTLAGRAAWVQDRFEYSPARDSDSVMGMIGLELRPRALINGSAFVGVRQFKNLGGFVADYQGLIAHAGLASTLKGSTTVIFDADRDVQYSFEPTQPYYVQTGLSFAVRRHLVSRYDIMAGISQFRSDYRDLLALSAPDSELARTDTTRNYSLSIGYKVGRDGRLGFGAAYRRRTSTTTQRPGYEGLRVGTSLTYGF